MMRKKINKNMYIEKIENPRNYFLENDNILNKTIEAVRNGFGTPMTKEDVFNHLVEPDDLYLIREMEDILGMTSYSTIGDGKVLFVEGVSIDPICQGKGIFGKVTKQAQNGHKYCALTTQSPRMYRALDKITDEISPNLSQLNTKRLMDIVKSISKEKGFNINENNIIKGRYGNSLYCEEQNHPLITPLFNEGLNIDYSVGDSVLCVGKLK